MLRKLVAAVLGVGLLFSLLFVFYGLLKIQKEETTKQKAGAELSEQLRGIGFQGQVQIQSPIDYQRLVVGSLTGSGVFFLALLVVLFLWPSHRKRRPSPLPEPSSASAATLPPADMTQPAAAPQPASAADAPADAASATATQPLSASATDATPPPSASSDVPTPDPKPSSPNSNQGKS